MNAGSVTQSEHSAMSDDDQIYVDMPGTQHVPFRRNDGSLDLYSDGKVSGGKCSYNNSEEDNSAEKDLQQYVKSLKAKGSKGANNKEDLVNGKRYESSDEENEMTYNPREKQQIFHTQPIQEPSDDGMVSNSEYNADEIMND